MRAEHDAIAQRLAARPSVDVLRRGAILGFVALLSFGVSWSLLWDLHGERPTETALAHPTLFNAGFAVTFLGALALVTLCVLALLRWRRVAGEEDRLFARLQELRRVLGIDP